MCRSPRRSARVTSAGSVPASRGVDLAAVLAQLGLDPRHARAPRRSPPRCRRRRGSSSSTRNRPYSFSFKPRWIARSRSVDVVRLRAGEVLHRGAAALGRHEPQVGLVAAAQQHARLGVALAEHALDARVRDEGVHQRLASPPTARMSMSPQVSQPRRRLPTGMNSTSRCVRRGGSRPSSAAVGGRVGQQVAAAVLLRAPRSP